MAVGRCCNVVAEHELGEFTRASGLPADGEEPRVWLLLVRAVAILNRGM